MPKNSKNGGSSVNGKANGHANGKSLTPFQGAASAPAEVTKPPRKKPASGYLHYKPCHADREEVRRQVLLGQTNASIAASLGIHIGQLTRHYGDTLNFYKQRMLGKVANSAYQQALKGNPFMVQFVLRTQGRWKEGVFSDDEVQLIKRVIGVPDEQV